MRIKSLFIMVVGISLLFLSCQKNDFIENMGVSVNMPENTYSKGAAVQAVLDKYVRLGIPGVTICIDDPVNGFWAGASGKACIEDNSDTTPGLSGVWSMVYYYANGVE